MTKHNHIKQSSTNEIAQGPTILSRRSPTTRIIRGFGALLFLLTFAGSCKDPYISPYKSPVTGYLVVEGYISGNSVTTFSLTRTISLPGDSTLPTEDGATVQVQGSDNSTVNLIGQGGGVYSSVDTMTLNPQLTYRLTIKTSNGEQYQSDYAPFIATPPIDSVNWIQNGDNSIQFYANTHSVGGPGFYQWNFDQTYKYHSADNSQDYYDTDTTPPQIVYRPPSMEIYTCWRSGSSTSILIANSLKLASNEIYEAPIKLIPPDDIQSSVLYSILVRQYGLTQDGYNFLNLMQQNTESLGSIFDAQPSQLTGNIHCITNPTEPVIGYISAGNVQWTRVWLSRFQITTHYQYSCPIPDTLMTQLDPKDLMQTFDPPYGIFTPLFFEVTSSGSMGWLSNYTGCLNCVLLGGTTTRPSFWPAGQ